MPMIAVVSVGGETVLEDVFPLDMCLSLVAKQAAAVMEEEETQENEEPRRRYRITTKRPNPFAPQPVS